MRIWSFNDNGVGGDNGGLYGPFPLKGVRGLMYLGATITDPVNGPGFIANVAVRAHYLGNPTQPTFNLGSPMAFVDGIPIQVGSWFKSNLKVDNWYFSVPSNGFGLPATYTFLLIEECDEFDGGNMGFTPVNPD